MITARRVTRLHGAAFGFAVVVGGLCAFAGVAQAASPAWKLLAVSGPTNLPPKQSEIQRVTVEAEGGTFTLSHRGSEGHGTPVVAEGNLSLTAGSAVATIESVENGAAFEVGDRITELGVFDSSETTIVSCSSDCKTPGSTVTLANPAPASETNVPREIFTKELSNVTGSFAVGDEIEGVAFAYFSPGTVVEAVSPGSLVLSKATTYEYLKSEGEIAFRSPTQVTEPITFNASAKSLQSALEALPILGFGSVSVSGGPGGSSASPFFVTFGGSLANQDVEQLATGGSGLTGEHAQARVFTVLPGGPGTGKLQIAPANIGGAATSGQVTVQVGPLPAGVKTSATASGSVWKCPGGSGLTTVSCTSSQVFSPLQETESLVVPVEVEQLGAFAGSVPVKISGGGAGSAEFQMPLVVSATPASPGLQAFWAGAFDADGAPAVQAGGHPFSAAADFRLNTVRAANGEIIPAGDLKDLKIDLPPGFIGNPLATARCPQESLTPVGFGESPACNSEATVGKFQGALSEFGGVSPFVPFYNDVPAFGTAAEFTFKIVAPTENLLGSLRSDEDFGVQIEARNNPNFYKIYGGFAALEGNPPGAHGKPFLDNPTACAQQREESAQGRGPATLVEVNSYQQPGTFDRRSDPLPLITGCQALTEAWIGKGPEPEKETPSLSFGPTTTVGSSPTGAIAHLHIPQGGLSDPTKLATSDLKKASVTLPKGLSVNPSSANGLEACSEAQIGYVGSGFLSPNPIRFDSASPTCPDGSKIGTFEVASPLLDEQLEGTIYLAAQTENPFHSLLALYLVVDNPRFGITLKLPGEVSPDPATGQLTATFDNNPQLPFEDLTFRFRGGGPRSTLATPEVCGHYATTGSLTPWSAEAGESAPIKEAGFTVSSGCASSAATRPFSPSFEAGTVTARAGTYSPLVVKVTRQDGEQELNSLDFTLPEGLIGKLGKIPYCSDSAIAAARAKTGRAELAGPSCPAASGLGTVDTAAGVGTEPIHVTGGVYLAGPYKGAPLSSVVITPAVAGPFDLGNVVIRAPLYVDSETAQITAKSDAIPTILKGIPLKVRSVAITLTRPRFALNPTSCEVKAVSASLTSSDGATATPANRFQVGGCGRLKFKPKLALSLTGSTQRAKNPALRAVLRQGKDQANIARVSVVLPKSEFIDNRHIGTPCTRVQFNAGSGNGAECPQDSILGYARAFTPLLAKPLEGPVYFRSNGGERELPDLVASLDGQVHLNVVGFIDSVHTKGSEISRTRNTFAMVPDAPVSKFVLSLKGGKHGLLQNSANLCKVKNVATVKMTAQNGLHRNFRPAIATSCKKNK